jgi:hypothetical protein
MSPESRALLCASHASRNDLRCLSSLQIRKPILKRISSGKAQSAQYRPVLTYNVALSDASERLLGEFGMSNHSRCLVLLKFSI